MALVKCRECGDQVSDQAHSCPHCGVPDPGMDMETLYKEFRTTPKGDSISCRECGKDLAENTEACPHCGAPIPIDLLQRLTSGPDQAKQRSANQPG